ncbi:amino acid adenylation domain-containing protein [Microseira sp. BLCC-F43]|jgi:amino acid adenylation domain-containing protein|uniref:non-ribosomal peptide synthetase n=1 Tax=Microseira sp. BLCC-F43 TaxID=3153602 RepID=UPI0035B6BA9B
MNNINQRIAQLSPAKRVLLEQRLKQKTVNGNSHQTISPRPNQEEVPLSFAQTRMWLLDQLEPGNPAYNCPTNIRLVGRLKKAALEQSINEIVRRHEVLRAKFPAVDGKPVQAIAPTLTLSLPMVDISHLPTLDKQAEVQKLAQEEAQRPFNLALDSLVRATLVRLGEEEHILFLTLHHIIFDGWSVGVILKELAFLYEAFCAGNSSPLSELPIQYADFAHWQQQHLQGEVLESQLAYWRRQLGSDLPVLKLPTDRQRAPQQTFLGARQNLLLPKSLTELLKVISQREGVTLFMTLLAAFQILLYRYTGQEDIVVGAPIAGRIRTETEKLIGVFINTLVLRTYLDGKLSFRELLAQVRKVAVEAYEHQDIPFEKLVEEIQPNRDLSHTPLFQVLFQLRNVPNETVEVQGIRFEEFQLDRGIAAFDLTLDIVDTHEGLSCRFVYNTDLFERATISRMAGHFQTLLEGIVANLEQPIGQLPLLTEAERHQLLVEWNNTHRDYPKDKCIHQLFEEQAERTPDAVAVVFEQEYLTYGELNRRANQLAHHLQALGVKPEVLVGICVERSLLMVVGLLGILKAGGAYMPLDPSYPTERLNFMLEDANVSVLLTQQQFVERVGSDGVRVVCLDRDALAHASLSQENPSVPLTPENLAYVIYTSGSTGNPKGVPIAHRGLCNLAIVEIELFDVQPNSRVLQFASFSFDASIWEIVMALGAGATLCLATSESLQPGQPLLRLLQEQRITHVNLVPSALAALPTQDLPALQNIVVGGEPCPANLVAQWAVGRRFFNAYGPTESTVCATVAQCFESTLAPPIGRPINNSQIYILDRYLQPVPIGVPGELHIAGVGLARGYLNRPDLTDAKFIPNPFSNEPGSRLYKTGDLVRYLPDGNIEFKGRIDDQVKMRGNRIELGEIETAICQHPEVRECVVIVRTKESGDKQLVAYVVPNLGAMPPGVPPTASKLRSFLKQKLPDYMVPAAFVVLESLPLSPNGKVDRRVLPAPDKSSFLDTSFVPPSDALEKQLAQIWSEILDVESVGVKDNFFALGGHSLLAVLLMAKIQQEFGKSLPLATLFQSPTIADLAALLRTEKDVPTHANLVLIQPLGNKPPFFCVHPVGGDVLCYADLARHLGDTQPFYALRALGLDGSGEPLTRIEDMAATYIKALQTIQPEGPYQLGGWSMGGVVVFEMAQQLKASGHHVSLVALIDSYAPIPRFKKTKEIDETMLLADWVKNLSGLSGKDLPVSIDSKTGGDCVLELQQKGSLEAQLNYILEYTQVAGIFPREMTWQQFMCLFQVFKANRLSLHFYHPQSYPGRVTLFLQHEHSLALNIDPTLGWGELATGGLDIHKIPGDHFSIIRTPVLAELLKSYLSQTVI